MIEIIVGLVLVLPIGGVLLYCGIFALCILVCNVSEKIREHKLAKIKAELENELDAILPLDKIENFCKISPEKWLFKQKEIVYWPNYPDMDTEYTITISDNERKRYEELRIRAAHYQKSEKFRIVATEILESVQKDIDEKKKQYKEEMERAMEENRRIVERLKEEGYR